ncbi:MAG TPA: hypothetical protein VMC07_03015 [Candidatus Omnitrophota bacterium]|nr:hypothetical protein [Candidatus Omnitrophota bacterium]
MTLELTVVYDIEKDAFNVQGNVKPELRRDFVFNFLRTQIGTGEDRSEAAEREVYTLQLKLDLNSDEYTVRDNCGNKGLRNGILLKYAELLN